MKPDDLCTVDMTGNQLAGKRKRTSEVLLHLEIYRQRPDIHSIVHCHPPHVNAFGIAREPIPTCVLPEPEIFLGEVPIANYETPNTQKFADSILPFVHKTNIIVLANHGTVSYDTDVERAYWLTEILDAYCRSLILAKQLGHVEFLSAEQGRELLEARHAWGFEDPRRTPDKPIDVREYVSFKSTWEAAELKQRSFGKSSSGDADNDHAIGELDHLVEKIADRVIAKLQDASKQ